MQLVNIGSDGAYVPCVLIERDSILYKSGMW